MAAHTSAQDSTAQTLQDAPAHYPIDRSTGELVQGCHAGWKHSGLGGKYGFDAYLKKKNMYVNWA